MKSRSPLWCLPVLFALSVSTASAQQQPDDRASMELAFQGEIDAKTLLRSWAIRFNALLIIDPQIEGVRLNVGEGFQGRVTWGEAKQLLDAFDIVVVEAEPTEPKGTWQLRAHHRRNLAQKEGPPWRLVDPNKLPKNEEIVTAVFRVKHGSGAPIFATLRGLLTRDTNRIGNILYVQGPEVIIIVDLASKVRYYKKVFAELDAPGPQRHSVLLKLEHARAQEVAQVLNQLFNPVKGVERVRAVADERSNQLVIHARAEDVRMIEVLVKGLDQEARPSTDAVKTISLKYALAHVAAAYIARLFPELRISHDMRVNGLTLRGSATAVARAVETIQTLDVRVATPARTFVVYPIMRAKANDLGKILDRMLSNRRPGPRAKIVVDERSNKIVVEATETDHAAIRALLTKLDQ